MATYAIGDVQGCYRELRQLLNQIGFDQSSDKLWLAGDLVNRGPQSLEVLRFVKDLGDAATMVLGNHDLNLIMLAEGQSQQREKDTLGPILAAPDREELLAWLRMQPMMHVEEGFVMVHAGLLPQWSVKKALSLAREVESELRGKGFRKFLAHMWGNKPKKWDDDLKGWDRLRVIVNAMTRLRFCTLGGALEFRTKGEEATAPPGYLPWFEVPKRKSASHVLVTGHWSALGLKVMPNLLALDSGCLWGGHLSAVRLEDRAVFQVDCSCSPDRLAIGT